MTKKEIRKERKMNLEHFLRSYYEVDNQALIATLSKMTHKQLKTIAPLYGINLVRTSFDSLDKEQLLTGTILLVEDCFHHPAPYVNPLITLSKKSAELNTDLGNFDYVYEEETTIKKEKGYQKTFRKIEIKRKENNND
jgi:hypothetical protein